MLSAARKGFCCQLIHKLPRGRTCSAVPWEDLRSHTRVTVVPAACLWRNLCVCSVFSELLSPRCPSSPGLLADCLLVSQLLSLILLRSLSRRAPKGCELWNGVCEQAVDSAHV